MFATPKMTFTIKKMIVSTSQLLDEFEASVKGEFQNFITESTLIGPGSIPWEIGNAFSAMFKRDRLGLEEAKRGIEIFNRIPIRYIEPNFANTMSISKQTNIYAYDAYFLDCALRQKAPLLTLDSRLKRTAQGLKISTLEA